MKSPKPVKRPYLFIYILFMVTAVISLVYMADTHFKFATRAQAMLFIVTLTIGFPLCIYKGLWPMRNPGSSDRDKLLILIAFSLLGGIVILYQDVAWRQNFLLSLNI